MKDFETIKNASWDQDITPSYVEVDFNSACNLSCSYCSPQYSSTWMAETEKHGAWPTSTPHNDPSTLYR
jgi:MoaA/NifB/PqqE/SkfB family radical SAM enzyme